MSGAAQARHNLGATEARSGSLPIWKQWWGDDR